MKWFPTLFAGLLFISPAIAADVSNPGPCSAFGSTTGTCLQGAGPLGSPSSIGTLPAHTLGGTIAGGGNQINNVVIGTTTPLGGAFTTLSASGASTLTGNVGVGGANASGAKLEVNSAIQVTGGYAVNATGAAVAYQGSGNSEFGAFGVDNSTNGTLKLVTARANGANGVTGATVTFAGLTLTTLSADTATADSTLCARTSDNLVIKGTGALGICLGTSGAQFKTAFAPMAAGIDDLMKINFQNYRYRDGFGDNGASMQYGTTAQDVERALPDLVRHADSGDAINYDSGALLFIGLRAIQQLKADNDKLRECQASWKCRIFGVR